MDRQGGVYILEWRISVSFFFLMLLLIDITIEHFGIATYLSETMIQ